MKDAKDELIDKLMGLGDTEGLDNILQAVIGKAKESVDKAVDKATDKFTSPELNADAQREAEWMLHEYANRIVVFARGLSQCKTKRELYELMAANKDILDLLYRMINVDAIVRIGE